jgi:hypothetical protein
MKRVFTALLVLATLPFAGCIDRDFDLANTSGEMTVGGEELVLPLGEIDKIQLNDLLGQTEGITTNEEGVYQISFSSFGNDPTKYEKVSIDGISIPNITGLSPQLDPINFSFGSLPTSLLFRAIEKPFDIDYPTEIGQIIKITPIKLNAPVEITLPSQLPEQGRIDDRTLTMLQMAQKASISSQGGDKVVFDATLDILEQLEKVDWVEFGCENHPYGAPFNLSIGLGGLYGVVGSGSIQLDINFPQGYYLRDENGVDFPAATHNLFSKNITLAPNQKSVDVLLYLHKIDYSDHTFTDGKLRIHDEITYSYSLSLDLCNGEYNLKNKPSFAIESSPEYKDVEVKINHFELPKQEYTIAHSFNGIPNGISIEKIAFTDNSNLTVSLKGLEWCVVKDNITGDNISPKIEIDMPRCMRFRKHPLLDENTNVLLASTTELAQGVTLSLESIDCKSSEGIKQENGQLLINEKIGAAVHMESLDGHTVLVSSITPPSAWSISMGIAESRLEVDATNSVVTWNDDKAFDFDLKDNVPHIAQTIDVPEMISNIKRIEIGKANSATNEPLSMKFTLETGDSFPVEKLEVNVAVNLGKLLRPTQKMFDNGLIIKDENGDNILSINETWSPKHSALVKTLEFDALENIPAIIDGKVSINQSFPVTGNVKIKSGENIKLSEVGDAKVNIDFKVDDIEVRTFIGNVDIAVKPESMLVDLGLGEIEGIDINAISLNPVLTLRLKDNPTGVGLSANVGINTFDSTGEKITTINIPTVTIAGNGASTIVISTPRNASKYDVEGVTFIAVDNLSQILKGLPNKIGVDMEVTSNKEEEITLDLKKAAGGYDIEYQYEVLLPFEFDGNIDLAYATTLSGLNETFVSLAEQTQSIKVGDIGLIAEFGTTIPFNIVVSAELVNKEGTTEGVAARLNISDCLIEGYNAEKDGEKKISKIDLDFDLGESGSLEGLKNADGVKLKFTIYNTDAEIAALNKNQFIDGKLKLRVRNGLTIDVSDLLKGMEE